MQDTAWTEWRKHQVTEKFIHNLNEVRKELSELLVSGYYTANTVEATAIKHAEVIGSVKAIDDILQMMEGF